jgi:hypothetical protein
VREEAQFYVIINKKTKMEATKLKTCKNGEDRKGLAYREGFVA